MEEGREHNAMMLNKTRSSLQNSFRWSFEAQQSQLIRSRISASTPITLFLSIELDTIKQEQ